LREVAATARVAARRRTTTFRIPERVSRLPVRCIVFSKDRPMQVDACLRSIERFAPYTGSVAVLYKASTQDFADGYGAVGAETSAEFVGESHDFQGNVLDLIETASEHTVFHTDDDVFFRGPSSVPVLPNEAACLSFRLGLNTTYSYPVDSPQAIPEFISDNGIIAWDWTRAQHDFAYPLSLDGHVMRTGLLLRLLSRIRFTNPNELEEELAMRRYLAPPWMMSSDESSLVSIPLNVVSGTHLNRAGGDPEMSPEALNARFLAGERIDLDAMDFSAVRGAHQEIPLVFGRSRS
jgi:hypothetical protein